MIFKEMAVQNNSGNCVLDFSVLFGTIKLEIFEYLSQSMYSNCVVKAVMCSYLAGNCLFLDHYLACGCVV